MSESAVGRKLTKKEEEIVLNARKRRLYKVGRVNQPKKGESNFFEGMNAMSFIYLAIGAGIVGWYLSKRVLKDELLCIGVGGAISGVFLLIDVLLWVFIQQRKDVQMKKS